MKITGTNIDSECMYCGSKSFGRGCPYGPKGLHVHVDMAGKGCVWCGSKSMGTGCPFNPFGRIHQRGITYNPIMVESLENGIIQGLVMKKLAQPINEMLAFKLGLIDDNGNSIRDPETLVERKSLLGVDRYLIKVRNLVKEKLEILNLSLYYENNEIDTVADIQELYSTELQCKDDISECVTQLHAIAMDYASKGISSRKFEQMIIESMLNAKKM